MSVFGSVFDGLLRPKRNDLNPACDPRQDPQRAMTKEEVERYNELKYGAPHQLQAMSPVELAKYRGKCS